MTRRLGNQSQARGHGGKVGIRKDREIRSTGAATPRRDEILAAAADLFARRGYFGASMRDIAAAVGLLPGSLYHHFTSKEELFAAVHERAVAEFHLALDEAIGSERDPWLRLRAAVMAHLSVLLGNPSAAAIVGPQVLELDPKLAARLTADRDRYERRFASLIAALPLPRSADRHLLRLFLFGALNWTTVWYRARGPRTPAEIAEAFVGFLARPRDHR